MSSPYIGEIRIFAGNFAPAGWALCNGALMPIAENDALFALIGTTYGGDGQVTFALPNIQSRVPLHQGSGFVIGQVGGSEMVTLTSSQIPSHTHVPLANAGGSGNPVNSPAGSVWSGWTGGGYSAEAPSAPMNAAAVGMNGGSQPHDNMMPFLAVNFIISLFGIFPTPT
jgi:microcystin-dependent protein